MGKGYHKKLGVNKAAIAGTGSGKSMAMRGGNGRRAGGAGPGGGAKAVAGAGGGGWGGAPKFSATDHSTIQTVSWQTYRSLTITRSSKAATAGEGKAKVAGGGNAKRSGGVVTAGPREGAVGAGRASPGGAKGVAGRAGGGGWGGAQPFSATGHSTFEMDVHPTNEYYDCSSDHGTFDTAAETMNEYYDEEENLGLSMDKGGDEDDGGQHDAEFL
uniref:Uncharacterized protein n=2 Tax=Triticum urartu TaxID=4572 RepID=A0A8R7K4H0_TRIUA